MNHGSSHHLFKNIVGQKFGKLLVLEYLYTKPRKSSSWLCKCECGNNKIIYASDLTRGYVKSCGCLPKNVGNKLRLINTTHGDSKKGKRHKLYLHWGHMMQRCFNSNYKTFKYYGGRGISCDPRWRNYKNFKKDMYLKYIYATKLLRIKKPTLERVDVNGNYCYTNCCFIEHKNQNKNKRNSKKNRED